MTPHLSPRLRSDSIATDDPEHVYTIPSVLGHTRYDTTQKYYNLGKSMDAARRIQATMVSIREPKDTQ